MDPEPLAGGQDFVFEATRTGPDGPEPVALKLLGPLTADAEARLRERWACVGESPHPRLVAPLEVFRGPGLVPPGDVVPGDDECDLLYSSARWVPGCSLHQAAPLPPAAVATIVVDLADALTHLHGHCDLIYRDLHPGNVIVGPDGHATLIDIGAVRPDDGCATTTIAGVLGFIAPERTHDTGDKRTDVWCLGMTTVYALLGHPQGSMSRAELAADLGARLGTRGRGRRAVALLEQAVAFDPAQRPTDLRAWAAELASLLAPVESAPRRRRAALVSGAVALAVVALGAWLIAASAGDDDGPGEQDESVLGAEVTAAGDDPPGEDSAVVGTPVCEQAFVLPDDAGPALKGLATGRGEALAGAIGDACAAGDAWRFGDAIVQPIREAGRMGAIVAGPRITVTLTQAQWQSYAEIAGRSNPENAVTFGGYPIAVHPPSGPIRSDVELSLGGRIIGARDDTQSFWLPPPVLELWHDRGGASGELGLPMSNPHVVDGGLRQDFEGGHLHLVAEVAVPVLDVDPSLIEVHIDPDPGKALRGLELTGTILRQRTGTAWFVDEALRRRWIVDGTTWSCLGGHDAVVLAEASGATVATLELGPPITLTCEG